jgi:hypothetical protein
MGLISYERNVVFHTELNAKTKNIQCKTNDKYGQFNTSHAMNEIYRSGYLHSGAESHVSTFQTMKAVGWDNVNTSDRTYIAERTLRELNSVNQPDSQSNQFSFPLDLTAGDLNIIFGLRFSRRWLWRLQYLGLWRRVFRDRARRALQKYFASLFTVEKWAWRLLLMNSRLGYSSTFKMESIYSSDTSDSPQTTRRYNLRDGTFLNVSGWFV